MPPIITYFAASALISILAGVALATLPFITGETVWAANTFVMLTVCMIFMLGPLIQWWLIAVLIFTAGVTVVTGFLSGGLIKIGSESGAMVTNNIWELSPAGLLLLSVTTIFFVISLFTFQPARFARAQVQRNYDSIKHELGR